MPLVGQRVRLFGLSARPELNGALATAESYVPAKGRYAVKLHDGSMVTIKPSNLEAAPPEPASQGDAEGAAMAVS